MDKKLPPPLEKSESEKKAQDVDVLVSEMMAWIEREIPYRDRLQVKIRERDLCRDEKSRVVAEGLVAVASISVMRCQQNIEFRKGKIIDIIGADFDLLEKYLPATPLVNTSALPLQ